MKQIVGCLILFLLFSIGAQAETKRIFLHQLYKHESSGVRYYKRGNYEKAYEQLLLPAQMGLKTAQYFMGFLYLKGQHVPQSVEKGMAWLGVANEIDVKDWRQTYDSVYASLDANAREFVDRQVALYIHQYGMNTQKLSCAKTAKAGTRKIAVRCNRRANITTPLYKESVE